MLLKFEHQHLELLIIISIYRNISICAHENLCRLLECLIAIRPIVRDHILFKRIIGAHVGIHGDQVY